MNKLYRVIWNHATGRFVVASELASSRSNRGAARLAAPLLMALFFPADAMATNILADGTQVVVEPGNYESDGTNSSVFTAKNGGDLKLNQVSATATNEGVVRADSGSTVSITESNLAAQGSDVIGLRAEGSNTQITIGDSTISAENSSAILNTGANIIANNVDISSGGGGASVRILQGGQLELNDSSISAASDDNNALSNVSSGSYIMLNNSTLTTEGAYSEGILSSQGTVDMNGGSITTQGRTSSGVLSYNRSVVTLSDVDVTTNGYQSAALEVSGNGAINANGGVISTTGDSASGLYVNGDGSIIGNNTDITTVGSRSYGVNAQGEAPGASYIALTDTQVTTSGGQASGLRADSATIDANRVTVSTTGPTSIGVDATDYVTAVVDPNQFVPALVNLTDSSITTTGDNSEGVKSTSSTVNMTGGSVDTSGMYSNGVSSTGTNSVISLTDVAVSTSNVFSRGLVAGMNALINVTGGSVGTIGDVSHGIVAGQSGTISADGTVVTTAGDTSFGVLAQAYPLGQGQVTISDSQVTTLGNNATGMGAALGGGRIDANRVNVTTEGMNAAGVSVGQTIAVAPGRAPVIGRAADEAPQSSVSLVDSSITTNGEGSMGVHVEQGSRFSANNSLITTNGTSSAGVLMFDDGTHATESTVTLTNSTVNAQGADSVGAHLKGGTLNIDGGSLSSVQGSAIVIDPIIIAETPDPEPEPEPLARPLGGEGMGRALGENQITINLSNGAQVIGGNGVFVHTLNENQAVNLTMDQQVQALGDINGDDTDADGLLTASTIVAMNNQSTWQGATNGTIAQIALNGGSQWAMTGNSTVGQMILNNSAVAFAQPTTGDYKTLTVTGDFSSDGGELFMNTELNDDNSGTDKLHVLGNTSGQASVHVNNVGGTGALTDNGIELITVDGQSDAAFALAGRAVGGSHEYFLHKGSKVDPNDGDWFLRSELPAVVPPIDPPVDPVDPPVDPVDPVEPPIDPLDPPVDPVDPAPPVDPVDPAPPVGPTGPDRSTPVYRPEVGSYLSNQAAAVNMFQMTMHDRLGNPELDAQRVDDKRLGSLWVRATRNEADFSAGSGQLDVDSDTTTLQLGADLMHWGEKGRGLLGVMAGTGTNKNTTRSDLTGYSSKGEVKGTSVGVYGTWFADPVGATGLYVDSWVQYGRYDNSVHGEGLGKENYDSTALTGSLEAGYGWKVFNNESTRIYVQPQLQITGTKYESDDIREANGSTIKSKDAGGFATRTGVRVFGQVDLDSGMKVQPFATVNFHHNSQSNAIAFNDSVMEGADPKNRYEFKTGAQLAIGKNWSTWGEVGVQSGDDDYSDVSAQVGLKYNF